MKACGHKDCKVSTGIHEGLTFGRGELDDNGYWEIPCDICARAGEEKYPEQYPCWPFSREQDNDNDNPSNS
ncbi:hypothetical protein LCGC14_1961570 [marine sediment metagenome]|uniref:Uncharacterized protein n=1 Tax=marine sediment metagenome TaxID=412755 RepID=A0A0F9IBM2_9ZZZZ